jgi:hypothetical protein
MDGWIANKTIAKKYHLYRFLREGLGCQIHRTLKAKTLNQ